MIVTLEETKQWLRVDGTDDDTLIYTLMTSAELYLKNATGKTFDGTNELAKLLCFVLIVDWYENREMIGQTGEAVRHTINSIMMQLSYGGEEDATSTI